MTLSMYQASVPVFVAALANLVKLLDKGEAFAAEHKIENDVLLNWRLAPDMYPLIRQVQLASDFSKGTCARLAGAEVPKFADEEKTFTELKDRVAKTAAFLQTLPAAAIDGSEDRDITLPLSGGDLRFKGQAYLLSFGLPNFYFHVTTAYDILRACGVDIGKRDFLGVI